MPYTPHVLVAFGGPMVGTPEIWGNTLRCFPSQGMPTQAALQELCDNELLAAVTDFVESTDANFSDQVALGYVKANPIGADGKYTDSITAEHQLPDTSVHGAGSSQNPYQVTCVAGLQATGRGPGHKGRIYLPNQSNFVVAGGTWQASATEGSLAAVTSLVRALSSSPIFLNVGVFSRTGPANVIDTIRIGNVPDTQRRRMNALVPTYVEGAAFPS